MRKRFLSVLLVIATLVCCLPGAHAAAAAKITYTEHTIAYIPLDNRPFNDSRVQLMAESEGYTLVLPDEDLYATWLDGQGLNENGQQYGDRNGLLQWILDQEAAGCNNYILSLDQLLSGGLMNSRCVSSTDLTTEHSILNTLQTLGNDPNNQIYYIDSVLRLAASSGFLGFTSSEYNASRSYGSVPRELLTGAALNLQNIIDGYPFAAGDVDVTESEPSGEKLAVKATSLSEEARALLLSEPRFETDSTADTAEEVYWEIRARKLHLADYALRHLNRSNVHFVIGVDDSSNEENIQTNEIAYLSTLLDADDTILSCLDGLAQAALAKLYMAATGANHYTANVTYFGSSADVPPSVFNYVSLEEMVADSLDFLNVQVTTAPSDLQVLVLTKPADTDDTKALLESFIAAINQNEQDHRATILIDASSYAYQNLSKYLNYSTNLGMLLSFSGTYEVPNNIIMAISQGVSRYRYLHSGSTSETADQAHLANLSTAMFKEFIYGNAIRYNLGSYIASLGATTGNFFHVRDAVAARTQQMFNVAAVPVLSNLTISNYIVSLSPYQTGSITAAAVSDMYFPFSRTFEVDFKVSVTISSDSYGRSFCAPYVSGMTATSFQPSGNLTRAQGAKLLVGMLGLDESTVTGSSFSDVSEDAWYHGCVELASQRGYVKGYGSTTFQPNRPVTRAEFASMLYQCAMGENLTLPEATTVSFSDVYAFKWYYTAVMALSKAGYISGYPDGSFRPDDTITRAEAVTLLNRMFGRKSLLSAKSILQEVKFADVPTDFWAYDDVTAASVPHWSAR